MNWRMILKTKQNKKSCSSFEDYYINFFKKGDNIHLKLFNVF